MYCKLAALYIASLENYTTKPLIPFCNSNVIHIGRMEKKSCIVFSRVYAKDIFLLPPFLGSPPFFVLWGGSLFCGKIFCGSPHLREEKIECEEKKWVGGTTKYCPMHQLTLPPLFLPQTRRATDYLPIK